MTDHPDVPIGTATLRWVEGQGYVNCPHLYRISVSGDAEQTEAYEVQTFLGPLKAERIALDAHRSLGRWPVAGSKVEALGPTAPGGSPTAYDDRSEW